MSHIDSVIQDPDRVAAVRRLAVLNAGARGQLDELARVAASAAQAPVSSISLLDGEREYFVTVHGVPTDGTLRHCPVERSICQFTVAGGAPLAISDLRADPRVGSPITLGGLEIVAYLGVPLRLEGGAIAGSLCVVDSRPRDWSVVEVTVLEELARTIAGQLALRADVLEATLHDPESGLPRSTLFLARCEMSRALHPRDRSAMYRIELPGLIAPLGAPRAGEPGIRQAARRLGEAADSTAVFGRLDRETLAMFAHDLTSEREALRLAGRMRASLRRSSISAGPVRIGIALADRPTERIAELLDRAEHVIRGAASRDAVTEIARRAA